MPLPQEDDCGRTGMVAPVLNDNTLPSIELPSDVA